MFDKNINNIVENVGNENDEIFFDKMAQFDDDDFKDSELYDEEED